ncbi:hypothetical protein BDF19DRAFT_415395 [Syncephalis fuscata]|nr:hypothetical protein BDF19DRAFT_415395 [Syncephalis fuscata]
MASSKRPTRTIKTTATRRTTPVQARNSESSAISPQQLSEQTYTWLTQELGYRSTITLIQTQHKQGIDDNKQFTPQTLETICRGPIQPILQHLKQHLFARTHVAKVRRAIQYAYEKHQLPPNQSTERTRLEETRKAQNDRMTAIVQCTEIQQQQCQLLVKQISEKENTVNELEERIRKAQHRIHLKRSYRARIQSTIEEMKTYSTTMEAMARISANQENTTYRVSDMDIVQTQKQLSFMVDSVKPTFKQHLTTNTAIEQKQQETMVTRINEIYNSSNPIVLLKAVALSLKMSSQQVKDRIASVDFNKDAQTMRKELEQEGYKPLLTTIEDCLQAHVQLFIDIKQLQATSKTILDDILQAESTLKDTISNCELDEMRAQTIM